MPPKKRKETFAEMVDRVRKKKGFPPCANPMMSSPHKKKPRRVALISLSPAPKSNLSQIPQLRIGPHPAEVVANRRIRKLVEQEIKMGITKRKALKKLKKVKKRKKDGS